MSDIAELDLDSIGPQVDDPYAKRQPSKIVVLGKPGTGKSYVINALLYQMRDRINHGIIISGTEDTNHAYSDHFPPVFVYDQYSDDAIRNLIAHQKELISARVENPWAVLVVDDCAYDKKFFASDIQQQLFKNSRHWYILYILALQYAKDIPPTIRASIDGTFIFREHNVATRRIIYENYASIIPRFRDFNELMDTSTRRFGTLYIDNMKSTDEWQDSVYYYRAPECPESWRFGSRDFWNYNYHAHHTSA